MPPTILRRPVTVMVWLLLSVAGLVLSPFFVVLAALASAITRRPQPLLLARFLVAYFAYELGVLVACGVLWLASGLGLRMRSPSFQKRHHGLLRWFVHGLAEHALELLKIDVCSGSTPDAARALQGGAPLIMFSRHAGPGDTVFLIDLLIDRYRRLPSVVFKETLAIDPSVDLIAHRLPHAVLDTSRREECEARIEQVTRDLPAHGVLVLFPEGGNFTVTRRRRAILKLWRRGESGKAAVALEMEHVMPPHPGGALAALRGNPEADVLFAAHAGLGLAAFPRELWRRTPIGRTFHNQMWLAPAHDRPRDPDEQVKWLYAWWSRLDEWVAEQGAEAPAS
ncbi:MAG TPA: 1-acyl-sn-glycerol-3-phosphate acyltransferase [Solirubrobacteraceae bacterium]|jgi:1-acyl-sn-glycerol-3-phosphate acyltransferase